MRNLILPFIITFLLAILVGLVLGSIFSIKVGNIALIKIHGPVMIDRSFLSNAVSSESIISQIKEAKENPLIKAVILDINSGGGSSVACSEVVDALKKLDKPCVAVIRDVGASGAYWIASACDKIIANKLSLVGSIGVRIDYLEFSGLLKKYNISYANLSYPEHKDMLSPYRPLTNTEINWVKEWLNTTYTFLVNDIAKNRNMSVEELMPFANGSLFMGYQAVNYGLIDELGGLDKAVNISAEMGNISSPEVIKMGGGGLLEIIDSLQQTS